MGVLCLVAEKLGGRYAPEDLHFFGMGVQIVYVRKWLGHFKGILLNSWS